MVKSRRVKRNYSDEFKQTVLKDMYENNLSTYAVAKKYDIGSSCSIRVWEKIYPLDSKLLSLSDEVITRVKTMEKARKSLKKQSTQTREEQLMQEVANLRKALAYSELRNEALHEVLKIGKEQYGIDLLKKAGAKQ